MGKFPGRPKFVVSLSWFILASSNRGEEGAEEETWWLLSGTPARLVMSIPIIYQLEQQGILLQTGDFLRWEHQAVRHHMVIGKTGVIIILGGCSFSFENVFETKITTQFGKMNPFWPSHILNNWVLDLHPERFSSSNMLDSETFRLHLQGTYKLSFLFL